ncbi:MAG TPA: UDP-3-O-acyl-N-acetylglucosamine deacetylase [Stellaceae bacterium]|nr:UDP-3-O-acyl-N-acetylglucosamine deacetylase [Stellaceae bacterium]
MLGEVATAAQQTLKTAISCRGVGLHSGRKVTMTLSPAPPESGIVFRRSDAGVEIKASWANTIASPLSTVLSNGEGTAIGTVEHLMAALAGAEIDNALVELDGPEVPIMDGSAAPFLFLIECAGIRAQDAARRAVKVLKPVRVAEDGAVVELSPDHGFAMSFAIDFDNPLIRRQDMCIACDAGTFKAELSRARTFGLLDDVARLRAAGLLRGGSLDNAIVVSGEEVLNRGGLRYADEFVRHKLLDAFGDLYLAGGPIIGHFRGVRSGHAHTRRLLAALFADPEAWCHTTIARYTPFGGLDLAAARPAVENRGFAAAGAQPVL